MTGGHCAHLRLWCWKNKRAGPVSRRKSVGRPVCISFLPEKHFLKLVGNQRNLFTGFLPDGLFKSGNFSGTGFRQRRHRSRRGSVKKCGIITCSRSSFILNFGRSTIIHGNSSFLQHSMREKQKNIQKKTYAQTAYALIKQITGVEPASSAWEANVLPMNHICTHQPERVPPGKSNV